MLPPACYVAVGMLCCGRYAMLPPACYAGTGTLCCSLRAMLQPRPACYAAGRRRHRKVGARSRRSPTLNCSSQGGGGSWWCVGGTVAGLPRAPGEALRTSARRSHASSSSLGAPISPSVTIRMSACGAAQQGPTRCTSAGRGAHGNIALMNTLALAAPHGVAGLPWQRLTVLQGVGAQRAPF
jgi:hypothetical protein